MSSSHRDRTQGSPGLSGEGPGQGPCRPGSGGAPRTEVSPRTGSPATLSLRPCSAASAVTASGCQGQRGRLVPPPRRFGEQFQSPVNGLFDWLD